MQSKKRRGEFFVGKVKIKSTVLDRGGFRRPFSLALFFSRNFLLSGIVSDDETY